MTAPATPEPGANPLDVPEARGAVALIVGGATWDDCHEVARHVLHVLAPLVASAQAAAWRAGVEAAAAFVEAGWTRPAPGMSRYDGPRITELPAAIRTLPVPAGFAAPAPGPDVLEALRPFAEIGQWLFARDLPDDTPLVEAGGINGFTVTLTRGHFKAAHRALHEAEANAAEVPHG